MHRIRSLSLVLSIALATMPALSQEPVEGSHVFGDLTDARISSIFESRRLAHQELVAQSTKFKSPDIAVALSVPSYLIAIATITSVHLPDGRSLPRTQISFHVEQFLRGESRVTDFDVESRWIPNPPKDHILEYSINSRPTVLDRSEPKKGDRYILGYTPDFTEGKTVFIPSAIDVQDPTQTRLIGDVEQFLTIESAAAGSGFEPYLAALDSSIPWIRQIAVQRLTSSDACNASPVCAQRFSTVVRRQLQSKVPNERLEASGWMVWIESVSRWKSLQKGWHDGLPVLPDSAIRELWDTATGDPNVYIGDEAFARREMFDFDRVGKPGECIEIVPALRKSAHWHAGEHDYSGQHELLPVGFMLTSSTSCIAAQK